MQPRRVPHALVGSARPRIPIKEHDIPVPSFSFARGNARKLLSLPLYALGWLASFAVRRNDDLWVFGCGSGLGEGALELYLHVRSANPGARLVWLARSPAERDDALARGLTTVLRSSWKAFRLTLRAHVIVITHGFGDVNRFATHGAYIVQLWHGIPLKKIHLDSAVTFQGIAPGLMKSLYRRSSQSIWFMPAASTTAASRLRSAFGLPADRLAVTGDPRDDPLFRSAAGAQELLTRAVGDYHGDRVVMFAPTWRDGETDPVIPSVAEWAAMSTFLERTSSILVVRPHPHSVGDYAAGPTISPRIRLLPATVQNDINPVLPAVDILVTDYSSVAFDFALLGRPIAFLAPDVDDYVATRGLYEPYDEFSGGTQVASWQELLGLLANPDAVASLATHATLLADTHHRYRDGRNTERVYEELLTRLRGKA